MNVQPSALAQCPHMQKLRAAAESGCPVDHVKVEAAGCPVDHAQLAGPEPPSNPRDLVPSHAWLGHDAGHTPKPTVSVEAWQNAKHFDVVVVGGGMSGLHTAWRLKGLDGSAPPAGQTEAPQVAVFEKTHHVGGRARSVKIDGAKTPIDIGAMRFIPSKHVLVNGLAEHFKLATHDFPVGGDQNLQYFRGVRLTNKQVSDDPSAVPFHVASSEQGKSANDLLSMAIEAVIPNFKNLTTEQWNEARRTTTVPVTDAGGQTTNVPLSQLGLQNVLAKTLSKEAVSFVQASLGYHRYEMNWDAGEALHMLSEGFAPGVVYKTPVDGMKAFPKALAVDLRKAGTPINTEQTLRSIDFDADKKQFHMVFESHKGEITPVIADKVVLAMPKAPLQGLVAENPFLQGTTLDKSLDKVIPIPMTRIYMTFDRPWWNDEGIRGGRSLTDLALGQVYYYGDEGDKRPYLQAYTDGAKAEYWEGLQNPGTPGVKTTMTATPQLGAELHRQLEELHGHAVPAPTGFLYKNWNDEFFGGATHAWAMGSQPLETSEAMITPVSGVPLYVCGEAFSTNQGWIEGALETSEKVLAQMGKTPTQQRVDG